MNFEKNCKKCRKNVHCCIFENDSGFTFAGIKDAKKIKNKINKEYSYFLDYSPLPKKVVDCLKYDDPVLEGKLRYSQLDKKKCLLRLKTKKDGRCIFLDKSNQCEIYFFRPNICKIFPFWAIKLINGKIKIISHDAQPDCSITKSIVKKHEDIDDALAKEEKNEIKKIFKSIKQEAIFYNKNIKRFIKKHNIC